MMWNYRIVKENKRINDKNYEVFSIRSIYYNEDGIASSWSEQPQDLGNYDSPDNIHFDLKLIQQSFLQPILEIVQEEGKEKIIEIPPTADRRFLY